MSSPLVQIKDKRLVKYGRRTDDPETASAREETQIATPAINHALPRPPHAPCEIPLVWLQELQNTSPLPSKTSRICVASDNSGCASLEIIKACCFGFRRHVT